jgi:hypothetical protein
MRPVSFSLSAENLVHIVAGVATAQQVVLEGQRAEPTAASRRERAAVV